MKYNVAIIFVAVEFLLFALHYFLIEHLEFIQNDYLFAFLLLIPAILFSAYIFVIVSSEPKETQDKILEHLIKESLHEINLPIATIDANIKMLKKRLLQEKDLKKIERIEEALKRLKREYKLLSYNLKKEILEVEKEVFDLKELIEDRVAFFQSLKRNKFILNLNTLMLKTDKLGLEQVVDNLIENAMKYSKKEMPIEIKIEDNRLFIKDSGIGIDESELSLIFQRYYQSDSSFVGEGIGLSIVKRFCDKEGIDLKIDSKKGVGTVVKLDFKKVKNYT